MQICTPGSLPGFRNWVPKIVNCKILGVQILKATTIYSDFNHELGLIFKIRHDILMQCHWNLNEDKKIHCMLEIDILRNSSQTFLGILRSAF